MNISKIVELIIDDENKMDGICAISLVEFPAIEENFMAFSKEPKHNYTFAVASEDKMVITGPAMIPNKQIYRYNPMTNEEYYVYFTKDTILKAAQMFLKNKYVDRMTIDHESNIQGVYVYESWIVKDSENDKAKALGYTVPEGTWMVSMKVEDKNLWEAIKNGIVKGFSIEAYLTEQMSKYGKTVSMEEELSSEEQEAKEIIEKIAELLKNLH